MTWISPPEVSMGLVLDENPPTCAPLESKTRTSRVNVLKATSRPCWSKFIAVRPSQFVKMYPLNAKFWSNTPMRSGKFGAPKMRKAVGPQPTATARSVPMAKKQMTSSNAHLRQPIKTPQCRAARQRRIIRQPDNPVFTTPSKCETISDACIDQRSRDHTRKKG